MKLRVYPNNKEQSLHCKAWFRIGSSVCCDPPVLNTDIDYMVLVTDLQDTTDVLHKHVWENCCSSWAEHTALDPGLTLRGDAYAVEDKYGASFTAFRKAEYNLIVTDDATLYLRSVGAHMVCKHLNLLNKHDRITLYRAIKYGEEYKGPLP